MANLIFSPTAYRDLSDIFDFIAKDKPLAAANWVETMEQKCLLLAETPAFSELRPEYGTFSCIMPTSAFGQSRSGSGSIEAR